MGMSEMMAGEHQSKASPSLEFVMNYIYKG
jgi:hypothetical protein